MMRRAVRSLGHIRDAAAAVGAIGAGAPHHRYSHQQRQITTRGQFNPVHDFAYAMERGVRARDEKAFEKLITNPGPLRIAYSPDYLDWLYRCYKAKGKYLDARAAAEKKFNGNLISGEAVTTSSGELTGRLPGAPPPGMFLRPPHSFRRLSGEMKRKHAQETLDEVAKAQGMLDLFERQPQFPAIHIDRCTRFHLVELFKEMVLERSLDATAIWDKALLYRAILSERKPSYPPSFRYIFKAVEETVFAPSSVNCPALEAYYYFLYLVKKYYIDNAVEAHVVLRCHREPNVTDLLFSNPPPKDDADVRQAIETLRSAEATSHAAASAVGENVNGDSQTPKTATRGGDRRGDAEQKDSSGAKEKNARRFVTPSSYPPIEALWRCEENLALLKILLFGEFNLIVSENLFVKFPSAHAFLTRPYSTESSGGAIDGASLAHVIAEKRGHLLPPFPRNVAFAIDGRAQDLRRLQQKHHRDDIVSFQTLLRSTHVDDHPSTFSSYSDWSYFNPRAVRAEERDRLTRKGIEALKEYDSATEEIYRRSFEDAEASNCRRVTEAGNTFPPYLPTLPHFVSIIKKDPHISFLSHVGLSEKLASAEAAVKHREFERRIYQLARALYHTALEFHRETVRRVNRQKVNVAASLLDTFVEQEWAAMLRESESQGASTEQGALQDEKANMARRLGRYMPFARRSLDEHGFPTGARADDYARWMEAPARMKGTV
ncbi:putative mitochondrial RNA binding complex 1 subunit [Trypanosoma conorhini]|uniref:Putative mitochondrial RNA binding complex 1 subunit n=1 Tax=Trypanosoma conorhini TaxID=83891 RepID=A0A422PJR2_9TRYP|nr:putative mitochondrial RNA binding complex 1 subunit [Trypanosoma conorhini]RNF17954.1 putative mitochondrial RNA binding complex 1 subunit [Trypanosoma conorhini]